MIDYNEVLRNEELFNTLIADPEHAYDIKDWVQDKVMDVQQQIMDRKPLKGERLPIEEREDYAEWRSQVFAFQRRLLKRQRAVNDAVKQHNRDKSDEEARTYRTRMLAIEALAGQDIEKALVLVLDEFTFTGDAKPAANAVMRVLDEIA